MAEDHAIETFAFKMLLKSIGVVLLMAALAYPLDFAVWRVRLARGGGMGSVPVERFTVADLKGGKEEYFPNGTEAVACSQSLYPQEGHNPCWWVERHREAEVHY